VFGKKARMRKKKTPGSQKGTDMRERLLLISETEKHTAAGWFPEVGWRREKGCDRGEGKKA